MSAAESHAHVERFNAAVTSGDWSAFLSHFAPDAVMTFAGPPVGLYQGIEAIAEGYATAPPTDTMDILSVREGGEADVIRFAWTHGGTGTLTIRRCEHLITELAVEFD